MVFKKCMIGFDEDLLTQIEEYAKRLHVTRTTAVTILCSKALEEMKAMSTMEKLLQAFSNDPERLKSAAADVLRD